MQRHGISHLAHAHHPVMAPLSDASVARLLDRLLPAKGRLLDLGCGQGEWIRRALSVRDGVTAVGVDLHVGSGVGDLAPTQAARATVVEADAATWTGGLFDAVLAQWALEPGRDPADPGPGPTGLPGAPRGVADGVPGCPGLRHPGARRQPGIPLMLRGGVCARAVTR
ncbi:SAM-dependent methyltransferase [Ornithinibacter aureus]|uniref:SAM-dependent methyltransferase n=1 Tax=Ornithinibacter aureus TaxID=622664 RepID=UPI001FE2B27B|nr:class I SAM-dependent methyltransferase [Ornithinibacter aureus]KAF0834577.1 hypothetical protein C8E84_2410 [Ornithinibacter aureus]